MITARLSLDDRQRPRIDLVCEILAECGDLLVTTEVALLLATR